MVKDVRSQSQEHPNLRSCFSIIPPCSCVQSQACSRNFSRLRSVFLIPFSANLPTTFASVAMLAWSVPGTQQAFLPSIRACLTRISWIVLFSICPIWSTPVTFGGGITTVYGSRPSGLLLNNLLLSQYSYHLDSTACGSYLLASSIIFNLLFTLY